MFRTRFFIQDATSDAYFLGFADNEARWGQIEDEIWFTHNRELADDTPRVLREDFMLTGRLAEAVVV